MLPKAQSLYSLLSTKEERTCACTDSPRLTALGSHCGGSHKCKIDSFHLKGNGDMSSRSASKSHQLLMGMKSTVQLKPQGTDNMDISYLEQLHSARLSLLHHTSCSCRQSQPLPFDFCIMSLVLDEGNNQVM